MLNGVILMLVVAAVRTATLEGPVLAFMIFVVAACELAVAIPIVLLLMKRRNTLDLASYDDLKG
jgi:NADH-quinone oxidoreductase subunit K